MSSVNYMPNIIDQISLKSVLKYFILH